MGSTGYQQWKEEPAALRLPSMSLHWMHREWWHSDIEEVWHHFWFLDTLYKFWECCNLIGTVWVQCGWEIEVVQHHYDAILLYTCGLSLKDMGHMTVLEGWFLGGLLWCISSLHNNTVIRVIYIIQNIGMTGYFDCILSGNHSSYILLLFVEMMSH